ncbi:MAG TPA: ribose-phosphate pyrophosphokinase [Candidatus Limnocylindrales bacterium]|nr:ribose-phosphate pyrophosphokinase [Candidatus Limnocylindrales bacterium]
MTEDYVLLTGRSNPKLATDVAKILKQEIHHPISVFSDGEIRVRIPTSMRNMHVFIIQPTAPNVNDSIMELLLMIDAAKRSSAAEISAIIPYYAYSRQDRKEQPRVPISSSVVANMIMQAGATQILTIEIHSQQQQGFVKIPWDNLYGSYALLPVLKSRKFRNLVVASPDKGGLIQATGYAKLLGAEGVALVYKERDVAVNNKSETLAMIGDVKGKNVLIVDDVIDTAGTIVNAANYIKKQGAESVTLAVTHGLFSGAALEKIASPAIKEVMITDSIKPTEAILKTKKIQIASIAPLLAAAIQRIQTGESISRDLILK